MATKTAFRHPEEGLLDHKRTKNRTRAAQRQKSTQ
jgi:hypothetical protein